MIIQAKIIDVEVMPHIKKATGEIQKKCEVTFKTFEPSETYTSTLWNNQLEKGEHKVFESLLGKFVRFAIRLEEYNGEIQASIYTPVKPVEVTRFENEPLKTLEKKTSN